MFCYATKYTKYKKSRLLPEFLLVNLILFDSLFVCQFICQPKKENSSQIKETHKNDEIRTKSQVTCHYRKTMRISNSLRNLYRCRGYNADGYTALLDYRSRLFHRVSIQRQVFNGAVSTSKDYHGRKLVGYSMEQMYQVVSDVRNYKDFVPFCKKSNVIKEIPGYKQVELEVGFPPISESYTSHVTLVEPYYVRAVNTDATLFDTLETAWRFSPGLKSNEKSCIVDFSIKFQFRSMFYSHVAFMFFEKLVSQMEWAFITEAKRRFGKESLPSHKLTSPTKT